MKKLLFTIGVFALSIGFLSAQQGFLSFKPSQNFQPKALTGNMDSDNEFFVPGATMDVVFNYNHSTPDDEWVDGISLDFPTGVTVNSATNFDDLVWNGETGDGVLVTWGDIVGGSGMGDLAANSQATVNITIDAAFSGDLVVEYFVAGDEWGDPPHTLSGNITLTEPLEHDLGVVGIAPTIVYLEQQTTMEVHIRNFGSASQNNFNVTLTNNQDYTEQFTVTENIEFNDVMIVEFPTWETSVEDTYTFTATVDLAGDQNPENDVLEVNINSMVQIIAYAANQAISGIYNLGSPEMEVSHATDAGIRGGTIIDGLMHGINNAENPVFGYFNEEMDTWTDIGPTGITGELFVLGMAYDHIEDNIYVLGLDGGYPGFNITLYQIDQNTGAGTAVATSPQTGTLLAIGMSANGNLYGIMHQETGNGLFYQIDKNTAELTLVGDMGVPVSAFFQSMGFDLENNKCYFQAYDEEDGLHGTHYIDHNTGIPTQVGVPIETPFLAIGIMGEPVGPIISETTPANNETDVEIDAPVAAMFLDDIFEVDFSGITIEPDPGNVVASIDGSTLNIAHDDFEFDTHYTVTIPAGSIDDGEDALFSDVVWSFTTMLDPSACNDPTNIHTTDISYTEVTLDWTENGPAEEWAVLYGYAGFNPDTEGELLTATEKPFTIDGLTHATSYDVYVQSLCGGSEESNWAGPFNFATLMDCSAPITVIPYIQNFEGEEFPPECWTIIDADGDGHNWVRYEPNPYIGEASAGSASWDPQTQEPLLPENYLITPRFEIAPNGASLAFFVSAQDPDYAAETFSVLVSTTGNAEEDFTDVIHNETLSIAEWEERVLSLDEYAGQDIYIAFLHHDVTDEFYIKIDHVKVEWPVINNEIVTNDVSIYPNPSSGTVFIDVTSYSNVRVFDISGRLVESFSIQPNETVNFNQTTGMYIVQIETDGEISNHRLVIN